MSDLEHLKLKGAPESQPKKADSQGEQIDTVKEAREFVRENVPENAPESQVGQAGQSKAAAQQIAQDLAKAKREALRVKLIAAKPSENQMKSDITHKLNSEMKVLKSEANKLRKKPGSGFELSRLVMKMREIQEVFYKMAHSTYEALKQLWLRVVHDIF